MACGTSSALAYPVLKERYKVQLISLIEPGAQAAVTASRSGRIGLIATAGTVNSGAYQRQIAALKKEALVFAEACPLFVPLIEGGFVEADETRRVAKEYLKPLLSEQIDTLILGCTHYPHLQKILRERTGPGVVFVDPAESAVAEARKLLEKAGTIKGKNSPAPKHEFLITGPVLQFQEIGSRLLGKPITHAKHVII
jgi:glutamate racemase